MRSRVGGLAALAAIVAAVVASAASSGSATGTSGAVIPQGTQSDSAYAASGNGITNVFATTQRISCYRPEVAAPFDDGPALGYSGESACPGATTGEDTGAAAPYATQLGSNPGYAAGPPQLVKDHAESDIRVDPTNPSHIIGTSKWFVSPEGYNHLMGFYESFDGGKTFPVQGHVPGFEGWTDNTDPVGAFDTYGNFYFFDLGYQFFYNKDGSHNFTVGSSQEPNPAQAAEIVGMAVRPAGAKTATQWKTTVNGKPDIIASYDSVGNEPDKQWVTIDTGTSPTSHTNRVYAMWVNFHYVTPVPYVSYADAYSDGTHSAWSTPQALPEPAQSPTGSTYLLPHVAPNGDIYTTVTNFDPSHGYATAEIFVDRSTDGGKSWQVLPGTIDVTSPPPGQYANTTFRDGIEDSFTLGGRLDAQGYYPLYVAYEDYSAGVGNLLLRASYDGGTTWLPAVQVNDNASRVDELQPNLSTAADGNISVAWYDRRLACPSQGTREGRAAGIDLDPAASGASNYCINASLQWYGADLTPIGHNVRLTQHTWDPQLNSPHTSCPSCSGTFIGDYFGNDASGPSDVFTFVSTYNDGSNPSNRQQQVVAIAPTP